MTLTTGNYAKLASAAYESSNDRALSKAREVHPDYMLDEELSGRYQKVFHNPTTKNTTVSFRGTSLKDSKDLAADSLYLIGMGRHSARFKNGKSTVNKVIAKYGKDTTDLTCHSLGCNVASDISKDTGLKTESFNKGKVLIPTRKADNEISHKVIGDPLSRGSTFTLPKKVIGNPHSLDNFF